MKSIGGMREGAGGGVVGRGEGDRKPDGLVRGGRRAGAARGSDVNY